MSARDEAVEMIRRICPPHLSADEYGQILAEKFDAHRTEVLAADGQAYDGELAMLRGLVDTLRVVVRHDSDLAEVWRLLVEYTRDDAAARNEATAEAATATPDFFQPEHSYLVKGFEYRCRTVETHPGRREREAWGWLHRGDDKWRLERLYTADYTSARPWTGEAGRG